jgi:SAM-dependent methyltransferase
MASRYDDVLPSLRATYNAGAAERDGMVKEQFKLDERLVFLDRLRVVEAKTLLEIGAGTGQDSVFFGSAGLSVVAVDLAPEMVARCRDKGLEAYERDVLNLGFEPARFDAVYSMNCLVHVPNADLPAALRAIRTVLVPGGLFFMGVWGGPSSEGTTPIFRVRRTDKEIFEYVSELFEVVDFHTVEDGDGRHFQSLTLVRPVEGS